MSKWWRLRLFSSGMRRHVVSGSAISISDRGGGEISSINNDGAECPTCDTAYSGKQLPVFRRIVVPYK